MTFQEDLKKAFQVVSEGGIILYPTDTIWGIGCDATNPDAVEKIFRLKKRADSKSMISLVDSIATLERWLEVMPEAAEMLIDVAVRPMTIIYDHPIGIAENLKASDGSAGFRITEEEFSKALATRLRKPLVSTSANFSGEKPAIKFSEIDLRIKEGVDYVVEFGRETIRENRPSDIIKVSDSNEVKIIR